MTQRNINRARYRVVILKESGKFYYSRYRGETKLTHLAQQAYAYKTKEKAEERMEKMKEFLVGVPYVKLDVEESTTDTSLQGLPEARDWRWGDKKRQVTSDSTAV